MDNRNFVRDIENYTNTTSLPDQWGLSLVALVDSFPGIKPMYIIRSEDDSMPASQQRWLLLPFSRNSVATNMYRMWEIPGNHTHAFTYWDDSILDTVPLSAGWLVKDRVIGYFQYFLQQGHTHF